MTALAKQENSLLNYELSYVKILGEGQMRAKCSHEEGDPSVWHLPKFEFQVVWKCAFHHSETKSVYFKA